MPAATSLVTPTQPGIQEASKGYGFRLSTSLRPERHFGCERLFAASCQTNFLAQPRGEIPTIVLNKYNTALLRGR
jgi:hypothetical protein